MQPLPLSHPGLPGDLVLLAAERTVTVTREEHHQDVLAGRTGPTIAELRPCTITAGKHAGQDGLEVVLDGRRVGELTRLMAQRYRPMVEEVRSRGYRAGCEAVLAADARGIQVELRLPSATERRVTEPPTAPIMIPGPIRCVAVAGSAGDRRLPRRSPAAQASTGVDPRCPRPVRAGALRRPGSAGHRPAAVPPPARGVGCGRRSAGARLGAGQRLAGRGARRQLVGAAVCRAAPAVPAAVEPSPGTTSAVPVAAAVEPAARSTAQARPPAPATSKPTASKSTTSKPTTSKSTASKPAPRTVQAAPEPEPKSERKSSGCDSNYDGCVPIASDVDCEGGSGNGPAYVSGPVRGHRYGQVRPRQRQGRHRLRVASPR